MAKFSSSGAGAPLDNRGSSPNNGEGGRHLLCDRALGRNPLTVRNSRRRTFGVLTLSLLLGGCVRQPEAPREVPVTRDGTTGSSSAGPEPVTQPPRAIATH